MKTNQSNADAYASRDSLPSYIYEELLNEEDDRLEPIYEDTEMPSWYRPPPSLETLANFNPFSVPPSSSGTIPSFLQGHYMRRRNDPEFSARMANILNNLTWIPPSRRNEINLLREAQQPSNPNNERDPLSLLPLIRQSRGSDIDFSREIQQPSSPDNGRDPLP